MFRDYCRRNNQFQNFQCIRIGTRSRINDNGHWRFFESRRPRNLTQTCPMPSLTEEDRDVTFWSDLLPPLGRGPLMRQFRRRGHRLWKGRRSTRRWMKQWKERKLKVTPSTLWLLTPKYVNLIPTKMQKNVFSPAVLSTLLHASNYFLAVPKMIDGKLANFL